MNNNKVFNGDGFIEYDDRKMKSETKSGDEEIQLMENGGLNCTGLNSRNR